MDQIKHFFKIGKNVNKIKYFNEITGIMSILIALWVIFYAIPNLFITLFYTLLGNLIILLGIILIGMFHPGVALVVFAIIIILYKISLHNTSVKEGIENLGSPPVSTVVPPVGPNADPIVTSSSPPVDPNAVPVPPVSTVVPIAPNTTASAVAPTTNATPSTMSNILTSALNTITKNVPTPMTNLGVTPPASTAPSAITPRWSQDTIDKFLQFQKLRFPTAEFNMDIIQTQATEQEALTLIQTGFWPWSKQTQDMYVNSIITSQVIKIAPDQALTDAMKLYNERAAKLMLSWNTKEGQLLLMGADLGASTYDPLFAVDKNHNSIKCTAPTSATTDPVSYMEKTTYLGTDYLSGVFKTKKEIIANADLPNVIPGFGFIKGTCNPCGPLNIQPDYGCPFNLHTKDNNSVSEIWQSLWNMK